MSTQTERFFSRKSSGRYGHGIRLNQVNFMRRLPRENRSSRGRAVSLARAAASSAADPAGFAFFDERARALHAVLRRAQQRREVVLEAQPVGEGQLKPAH